MRRVTVACVCLAALGTAPAPARAASSAAIIRAISAARTADGIPGGLVEDPALSAACARHDAYMAANPDDPDPHTEERGAPGYSAAGAAVAPLSVLAPGRTFDAGVNPFAYAPFHLMRELAPSLRVTGAADAHGSECVVVADPRIRSAPGAPRFFTSPGPGRTDVAPVQFEDREAPFGPADLLGSAPGMPMGPHLDVFRFPDTAPLRIRRASLTGPAGRVPLRWIDATSRGAAGLVPGGALLVAPHPVPEGVYCARIELAGTPAVQHRWWFATTGATAPRAPQGCAPAPPARLRLRSLRVRHGHVTAVVTSNARARGRIRAVEDRGGAEHPLRAVRTTVVAGVRRTMFSGRVPGGIFRVLGVSVTMHRSDGGDDAALWRTVRLG